MLEKDEKSFREVMLALFRYLREQSTCHAEDRQEENYYILVLVAYNGFSTDFRHLLKQCEIYDIDLHRKLQKSNGSPLMDTFDAIVRQDRDCQYLKSLGWDPNAEKAQTNSYLYTFLNKVECPVAHGSQVDAEMTYKVAETFFI